MSRGSLLLSVSLAAIVCLSGAAALGDKKPFVDQAQTDERVKYNVEERLRTDGRIDWEVLAVDVQRGHVTLYGEVETKDQKGLAGLIASTVPGVRELTNSIIVDKAISKDHRLQKAVWNALRGVDALREQTHTLRVRVKNAIAKLSGSVEQSLQREAAIKAAESVQGVKKVVNAITVGKAPLQTEREKLGEQGVQQVP
jgi:osmotically-inducible protein OsmY